MRIKWDSRLKKPLAVGAICFILAGQYVLAQNLGAAPQFKVAVQGQTGAQPEGAFLNFINWVGNVIAPVGAGSAVMGAIVKWERVERLAQLSFRGAFCDEESRIACLFRARFLSVG